MIFYQKFLLELINNVAFRRRLKLSLIEGGIIEIEDFFKIVLSYPLAGNSLTTIAHNIKGCTRCELATNRQKIVFGKGKESAKLMLIGEAPGAQEDKYGLPFVGPAGQLLERMLVSVGLSSTETYITNIVKCRPLRNRAPSPKEIIACYPFLWAQIYSLRPQIICALGRFAAQTLLATNTPITTLRGRWTTFEGIPLISTFHPAFLLRNSVRKAEAYKDLKSLAARILF